jgi:cytochrome b
MSAPSEAVEAGGVMPSATATAQTGASTPTVRVWDPFVRIFHWSLVSLFIIAFITGDKFERLHIGVGYAIIGLVALRVVWGFLGSRHARFGDFVRHPAETLGYMRKALRGRAPRYLGHNPAGGLMTLALLGMIAAIGSTGFMMTTGAFWGAEWVEDLHVALVNATLGLIALHVAGVLVSSYEHSENLIKAMITGHKRAS